MYRLRNNPRVIPRHVLLLGPGDSVVVLHYPHRLLQQCDVLPKVLSLPQLERGQLFHGLQNVVGASLEPLRVRPRRVEACPRRVLVGGVREEVVRLQLEGETVPLRGLVDCLEVAGGGRVDDVDFGVVALEAPGKVMG